MSCANLLYYWIKGIIKKVLSKEPTRLFGNTKKEMKRKAQGIDTD